MPPRHPPRQRPGSTQHHGRPSPTGQQANYRAAGSSGRLASPQRDPMPKYDAAMQSIRQQRDANERQRIQKWGSGGGAVRPQLQPAPQQQWQPASAAQQVFYAPNHHQQQQQQHQQQQYQPAFAAQQAQHAQQAEHAPQHLHGTGVRYQEFQDLEVLQERRSSGADASSSGGLLDGTDVDIMKRMICGAMLTALYQCTPAPIKHGLLLQAELQ